MAKKQNKSQPTSTTETNLTPKGMIKDVDASYMSKQNWRHARNAINNSVEGDTGVIGNEPANLLCATVPYTIIGGIHLHGDIWAIFSTDNVNSEIGKFDDSRCEYETIINDPCLNFNTNHLIVGASKENYECQWQIYWDDSFNPSRTLNIDDIPWIQICVDEVGQVIPNIDPAYITVGCITCTDTPDLDCDAIRLAPYLDTPCIEVSKSDEGGSLVNGTYQAFIAYTLDNQVIGDYIGVSNLQSFWDHSGPSGSLQIEISNLDKDFENYQLVIRYKTHNAIRSKIIGYYSTQQTVISIDYIDDRLETVPDITLVIRNPVFEKSDGMWVVNDYLIRSGPTEKFDFNYQPLANLIQSRWVSYRYPANYYENGGNKPSFMRDEQYAFFIRWIYNTGDKSKAYHIPGRPAGSSTWAGPVEDTPLTSPGIDITPVGATQELVFEGINTAVETVSAIPYNTIVDQRYSGVFAGEGTMGYWESTEKYPQDSVRWNSNTGNPDYDLCGKQIRHHKFPDETSLTSQNATLLSPSVNGESGQFINILGVKFQNIMVPVDNNNILIPGIAGYEILTGNRSGNKSIIAKGIIRNMFTYQRDTAPPNLTNANGPRQTDDSWGIFPNYPYNDIHTDTYLINRNRGELVSSRPWFSGIEDNFLVDPHKHASTDNRGLNEITRDYFTFHSPDAMFSRMFLNPHEIKLYKSLRGTSIGNFKRSEDHPRFKLIKRRAVIIAAIIGVGYALNQMRGPETIEVQGAKGQPSGEFETKALGSGVAMAPFPVVGNGISLINSLAHVGGALITGALRIGMEGAIDVATIMGGGRMAIEVGIPLYNAAEGGATGLAGAGSGGATVMSYEGTDFTGVPTIMAMLTGIYAFLNYIAIGGDKILDLIRNLISYQDYVYKYISHGFYDTEVATHIPGTWTDGDQAAGVMSVGNDSRIRSEVEDARYIKQALSAFPGNLMVNNLKRQSTIVLHTIDRTINGTTGPGGFTLNGEYGGLMDPNGDDFSKFVIGDGSCNDTCIQGNASVTWYSPGATTCKPIAVNYAALKVNIDNQYGQIDNILMQPSGECNTLDSTQIGVPGLVLSSSVGFGGDVYINRYTEKTSMPFFWDFVKEGEDGMAWDYKQYPNIPMPRYWLDSNKFRMDEYIKPILNFSFDWNSHTPSDLYHLDRPITGITCEGGGTLSGSWTTNVDDGVITNTGTGLLSYDTTDETLVSGWSVPDAANGNIQYATGWLMGAWEIPMDYDGISCTCTVCATCPTLCGPLCNEPMSTNGQAVFNSNAAAGAYVNAVAAPYDRSFMVFQATTDNDPTTNWQQTGNTPGVGGIVSPVAPALPLNNISAQANFNWHENYSVIELRGELTITVPLGSASNKTITIGGNSAVVEITHPVSGEVRDVQGIFGGEYDRADFYNSPALTTIDSGQVRNMSRFWVDNAGAADPNYTFTCQAPPFANLNNETFRQLEDDTAPSSLPSLTFTAQVRGLAALYNWNTGFFERVVNPNLPYVQPYGNTITPTPLPSGSSTAVNTNAMLPVTDCTQIRIHHGGSSRVTDNDYCWVFMTFWPGVHNMTAGSAGSTNKGAFGFSPLVGGNGYAGQLDTDLIFTVTGGTPAPPLGTSIGGSIPTQAAVMESGTNPDNAGGPFVVTRAYMYTHNNGVQDFFVESEINTACRDYSDGIMTRHYNYADYTDISTMFDASVQDVDNYYKYDKSLSQKRFWNTSFGEIQPRWYDPTIAEDCLEYYPKRLIYSLPTGGASIKALKQQKKEANKDFWRIYLSKNYRDFKSSINTIKPINKTGALVLFPTISPQMFIGVDTLKPTKNGTKLIIGDGGLFSQAFQNVANSDVSHEYGSCESARSVVNTPMGLFYISQAQGKIFQYGSKGVSAISDLGMKWWFAKYLPSELIAALPDVLDCPHVYDNPVAGIGTQSVYDPVNDIVYFMKRDYEVLSPCVGYIPCEGFFIDNDCMNGSGSGFGSTTITYECAPGSTWNPAVNACETIVEEPCVTNPANCPTGYQNTALCETGGCECCQDDSPDGCCESNVNITYNGIMQKGCRCLYHSYPTNIIYPNQTSIELSNTAFFNEISWTVSYDPKAKAWISFHDWHPELSFNSINHFLTTKEEGTPVCPPGYVWDPDEELCCEIASWSGPRMSQLSLLYHPGVGGTTGSSGCVDDIDVNTGTPCIIGYDLVLPCGQNAATGYTVGVCARVTCNCDQGGSNFALSAFLAQCEGNMSFGDSWDTGVTCPTPQEIWDFEHNPDGTSNYQVYIDPGVCEATCKRCMDPERGTSIWRHNTRTDLFANYYGIDYPWEVDLIEHSGQTVATIRSLEYQLESYIYQNDGRDRFHDLDWNFDEAIIYNTEQVSGLLRLNITPKNNPVLTSTFPIIGGGFIDILYSKEEQKYRFNQFWDITADRGEFTAAQQTIFNTQMNGYIRNLNAANMNYAKAQIERKKFRHYYNHILLRRVQSDNRKMLLRLENTKLNISMR